MGVNFFMFISSHMSLNFRSLIEEINRKKLQYGTNHKVSMVRHFTIFEALQSWCKQEKLKNQTQNLKDAPFKLSTNF
jgi:hypothetical protein